MSTQQNIIRPMDNRWLYMVLMGIMLIAKVAQADIYFWEDSDGVIHFSNRDAPPMSELYVREGADFNRMPVPAELTDPQRAGLGEAQERQEELQEKLDASLERVDQLTRSVEAAQEEARNANLAAQQALEDIDQAAYETANSQTTVRERIVYYAVPRVYKKAPHRKGNRFHLRQGSGRQSAVHRNAKRLYNQGHERYSSVHRKPIVRQGHTFQKQREEHLKGKIQGNTRFGHGRRIPSTSRGARFVRN